MEVVRKKVRKNYKLLEGREGGREGGRKGRGGWRIVIPMPEALNAVEGRRQKAVLQMAKLLCIL
jgi:hypothetical protein